MVFNILSWFFDGFSGGFSGLDSGSFLQRYLLLG